MGTANEFLMKGLGDSYTGKLLVSRGAIRDRRTGKPHRILPLPHLPKGPCRSGCTDGPGPMRQFPVACG